MAASGKPGGAQESLPAVLSAPPVAAAGAKAGAGGAARAAEAEDDEEEEWEEVEEVSYVVLDLGNDMSRELLLAHSAAGAQAAAAAEKSREQQAPEASAAECPEAPVTPPYALVGLETSNPFLQVGRTILRGQWDEGIGVDMVFSLKYGGKPRAFAEDDPAGLDLVAMTSKRIKFSKITVKPKPPGTPGGTADTPPPADGVLPTDAVSPTALDDAEMPDVWSSEGPS